MADPTIHTQAIIEFYPGTQINEIKSKDAGRPMYDDIEMVKIVWAGNTKSELHAPADDRGDRPVINPIDKSRSWPKWKDHPDFKPAYDAFKSGQEVAMNGTPISELTFLTEARRAELRAVKIFTVEALAGLDSQTLARLGGLSDLKKQAHSFLERAAGAAVDARHEQERAAMQRQIDDLKALVEGRSTPAAKPAATSKAPTSASPFESWADEDIKTWIKEADPESPPPHNRCGHATLVKMADDINQKLQKSREQVAA